MRSVSARRRLLAAGSALALVFALAGCASQGPEVPANGPGPEATDPAAERAAMECVTGAWVADTAALQLFFDDAMAREGVSDFSLIAEGSIVYEFIEHGFGLTVIPTAFGVRMPTGFGDVVGTFGGQASGVWTVKGEYIHAAGDAWQSSLAMRWTFMGADFEVDTGMQEMMAGFTDVDRFECAGDVLVLQSHDGGPLTLTRMVEVP